MPRHFQTLYKNNNDLETRNDAKNKWDFSLVLEVCREFDDATAAGKLFHVRATAEILKEHIFIFIRQKR